MSDWKQRVEAWLQGPYDEESKTVIRKWQNDGNEAELQDAFYKSLEFGTGGLRGVMGVGSNRVNKYTLGAATQGLSNYLKKVFPKEQIKVAVAYDSRNNSKTFARITADVFSANGVKVYLYPELRPTPLLSFAIRHLGCQSGVVLTASHNPKEYNGYKAYWNDGAQIIAPHDKNIIDEVNAITSPDLIQFQSNPDLIEIIGKEVDEAFLDNLLKTSINKEVILRQKDLKIVFSSLHGTGITLVPEALRRLGFEQVHILEEQSVPDGNFPTVVYPNPEEKEAMTLSLQKAGALDADLVMATDPDADRVGIAAKNSKGEFALLNGNQTATLIIYYLLEAWKQADKLKGKEYITKTIVTTYLLDKIAEGYGVKCYNTLTGFKYIAGVIRDLEGKEIYIAGGEESYGYLIGDFVRDKDAITACAIIAELTAYAKDQGKTLFDLLINIYQKYGFYKEHLISLTKKGKAGEEEIKKMMDNFRNTPPARLSGSDVLLVKDYEFQVEKNLKTGIKAAIRLPKSNVIQLLTEDGTLVSARPSGTEPKIKFYISVNLELRSANDYDSVDSVLTKKIQTILSELGLQ